jgi:hypothetical protein
MTVINLNALKDTIGGRVGLNALVSATVYRGLDKAFRRDDSSVVFPAPVTLLIVNGMPNRTFDLPVIPADCYWRIAITADDLPTYVLNAVVPAISGSIDFEDLIEVTPTQGFPELGTSLGDALVAQLKLTEQRVRDAVGQAEAARNAAIAAAAASKGLIAVPGDPGYFTFAR